MPSPQRLALAFAAVVLCASLVAQDPESVTSREDAVGLLLREWFTADSAAGNRGDYYDNRDGAHSPLDLSRYPQLQPLPYTDQQREEKLDFGPAQMLRPETVVGNASLSGTAVGGASIPRLVTSSRESLGFLTRQYLGNQLYVYPEHQDHDPAAEGGHGDLYATNTPYLIVSQGSSRSDLPFVEAVASTLAAMPPEVKESLRRQRLLMPVVQQILRSSLSTVKEREDYLGAGAHPSAFSTEWLDEERMVRAAQALTPQNLPPVFHLSVVHERPAPRVGIDFFESAGRESESLADEGMAIARVFRGMAREREITVRVARLQRWSERPIRIHWKLLRGDPALVGIERSTDQPEATIRVRWHDDPIPAPGSEGLAGRRVEIGVFADDGERYSPPCFVTFYFLPNERRRYDDEGRVLEADYRFDGAFVDVTLTAAKPWRDLYRYDEESGMLLGWTREGEGEGGTAEFDAEGRLLAPDGPRPVRYELDEASRTLRWNEAAP